MRCDELLDRDFGCDGLGRQPLELIAFRFCSRVDDELCAGGAAAATL